jgi:type I restriction-modification system DNA methylase subunit
MANKTSYSYQIELLSKLKEQLEIFREDLSTVSRNYKTSIQNLHDQDGLMDETYNEYYSNYLKPTVETINEIVERMDTEDLSYVEKEINFLISR